MKKSIFLVFVVVFSTTYTFAQSQLFYGTGERPLGENAQVAMANWLLQRNPNYDLLFSDVRAKSTETLLENAIGSPYINPTFRPCKIYWRGEEYGDFFYRYNALNDEVEIRAVADKGPTASLNLDKMLRVVDSQNKFSLLTLLTPKQGYRNGYADLIFEGKNVNLYKRTKAKYTPGTKPANSLVRGTPDKFSHFAEYYFKPSDKEYAIFIERRSKKFLENFEASKKDDLKVFMKENKVNLNDEKDLMVLFNYINSLNGVTLSTK